MFDEANLHGHDKFGCPLELPPAQFCVRTGTYSGKYCSLRVERTIKDLTVLC
ncbi:MAG: hypothetical protein ACYSR7_00795 [Planctomycetota bacterium]